MRGYRILRPASDQGYVMIDLEFEIPGEAEAMHRALRELWSRVEGTVMMNPQARIVEVVESREY